MVTLDTSNLSLSYFTDNVTFSKRIVVNGADPTHTPDLRKLGGVFNCYLEGGKRGWVFGISTEPALEAYIQTGKVKPTLKKAVNVQDMSGIGDKKDTGMCILCKQSIKLDTAVKSYLRFYAGGLPLKVTGLLMDKDYRAKISVAFANGTFTCTDCLREQQKDTLNYTDSDDDSFDSEN